MNKLTNNELRIELYNQKLTINDKIEKNIQIILYYL